MSFNRKKIFLNVEYYGGDRSAMVIIVGNGYGDPSSNSGLDCLHLTLRLYHWKRYESEYSFSQLAASLQRVKTCSTRVLIMTLKNLMVRLQQWWSFGNTPSLPSLPGSLWPGTVAPDRVLSMGKIELNCILIRNLFEIGLFWHLNCVPGLNWIVWNRTVLTLKS